LARLKTTPQKSWLIGSQAEVTGLSLSVGGAEPVSRDGPPRLSDTMSFLTEKQAESLALVAIIIVAAIWLAVLIRRS
jgi:hypothetical protein